jgi:acetoin:2,6-dichlorophenolindophenol oxidoreductase subunit alpha
MTPDLLETATATDNATLLEMWRRMLRIRRFDEEATTMLRLGELPGVLHLTTGQEAAVVGACMALAPGDYVIGTHRNHGHPIGLGADLKPLMAEVLGKATGVCKGKAGELHLIAPDVGAIFSSAILGSGVPMAVGTALTSKTKRTGRVTLVTFGDGASNEGAVHESMNLAAIWRLPVVFVCENNGYSVTVPATYAVSVADVADRAAGYGMPGHVVDGSDPVAVGAMVAEAAARARRGEGPSLVEVKTYRTVDHAENLPNQHYREDHEVAQWRRRDPLSLLRARLTGGGVTSADELDAIAGEVEREVAEAVAFARESPYPEPDELWRDMYVDERLNRPPRLGGGTHA